MSAVAMQACPGDDTITLLVCGQLAGAEMTALQSHVVDCASCRKLVGLLETALPEGSGNDRLRASMLGLLAPGTVVGRYRIEDALGAGGMGVVYAAHDPELDRKVALKLLYPMIEPDGQDELALRLRHESTTMARLRHPNVATIHDIGSYRDQLFLVMELVQGTTLRAWVGADKPWQTVIATFVEAGKGLAAAHHAGIIHCDFKPDNVLLDADGRPLITDFGLAQVVASAHARPRSHATVPGNPVTALGSSSIVVVAGAHVFGTPAYMAPERFDATIAADIGGDVFAFCVALYEVLYGRRPFEGATVDELRAAITRGVTSNPPDTATVPAWLHRAIVRGLGADRYRSIGELVDALQAPPRRRSRWIAPLAGAGVVVVAVAGWQLTRHDAARAVSCNARGELAGIWDDATRARIAGAWTGSVNAHTWERVRHTLDRYSDAWVSAADAACVAPSPTPAIAEFKQRCLHAVELKLHAVVDRFATSEATVVATADRTVASLPSLDDCGNEAPATPIPSDPFLRAEVGRLRDELAAADAQSIAGKFDVAATAIDKIAARARTVDFKPLTAEIQYSRAINLRGAAAKPEVTTAALRDAAAAAEASGDEVLAVKAWSALAFQAGEVTGDFERGREYVGYAGAALERLGGNPRLETQIETTRGRLDWHQGKLDDARREYEHALSLAKTDPVLRIEALGGLAVVDTAAGQLAKALDEQLHVLELRRKMYGDDHPEIARSYTTLGDVTMRMARLNESLDYYQKADATAQRVFGPEHSMCQITAHNLGGILRDLERPADAEREFRRAVRIATVAFGADHPYTAKSEQSLGMALFDQGKFTEAVTTLRHAVAVKRKAYGDAELETIGAINDLAIALRGAGKLDESLEDTDKAIAGFAATEGPKSDDLAQAYLARCRTLIAAHRGADAEVALAKAKSIFEQTEAPAARYEEVRLLQDQIHPKSR
jgi:serine/threonine protein kinase/tetratricopeptide (TPR) repeat protein